MPTYSSPKYNNRVGVYRTNEIERFGTASVVPANVFMAGEFICMKFTPTGTIKASPTSIFDLTGVTWTGAALFANAVTPSNSYILLSTSSPILVNSSIAILSAGNSLFTVSSVSTTPTIGTEYWFVFKVATGCTITMPAGSQVTYSSTIGYVETLKDSSYLSITY